MYMDIEPSLYNSSSILLCPKCNQIPSYKIISSKEISFQCDCSNKGIINLTSAANILSNYCDRQFNLPQICRLHNLKMYCYCESCRCNLCYQCLSSHLSHSVIKYKSLKNRINNRDLLTEFKEAKRHLQQEHSQIKNEIVKELTDKIKKIENSYKTSVETNKRICTVISMIIDSYKSTKNTPNYHIVQVKFFNFSI